MSHAAAESPAHCAQRMAGHGGDGTAAARGGAGTVTPYCDRLAVAVVVRPRERGAGRPKGVGSSLGVEAALVDASLMAQSASARLAAVGAGARMAPLSGSALALVLLWQ